MEEEGAGFSIERAVRQSLYWPDGTIRKRTKSYIAKKSHNQRCLIAQALVDKYNEDYILLKVCALSLPPVPTLCLYPVCTFALCLYYLANVTIADLIHASYFRMMPNLNMF